MSDETVIDNVRTGVVVGAGGGGGGGGGGQGGVDNDVDNESIPILLSPDQTKTLEKYKRKLKELTKECRKAKKDAELNKHSRPGIRRSIG